MCGPLSREVRVSGYNNNWSDDDFENEGDQRGGGGLRKLLEETLAENKKLREAFEGKEREKSTAALLKDKGLDPAIAELIPDGTDAAAWVDKYAHLLGVPANTPDPEPAVEPDVQASDDADPAIQLRKAELAAEAKALAEIQDAAESGVPASVHDSLVTEMDKIDSEDALMKFFKEHSAPVD
jgi:hypothetical protein